MRSGNGWGELLRGGHGARALVVGGGMAMHAINVFITITILPSVTRDIGGLDRFAWATTLYVLASVFAGGMCARLVPRTGARGAYRLALALFLAGSIACAMAPSMTALIGGRVVQGLGAGLLSALSYTMVRALFPERLWPTAISVISASWGIATTGGPAVGGLLVEYATWRTAFWSVAAVAPVLWLVVERSLPRDLARPPAPASPLAWTNLALLLASVLAISAGSAEATSQGKAQGLMVAGLGLTLYVLRERRTGGARLMASGTVRPSTPLGATFLAIMAVIIGINTEIFVPYLLQTLHGLAPVNAGYLSALMSMGWTIGSMLTSGVAAARVPLMMRAGPLLIAAALLALDALVPRPGLAPAQTVLIAAALLAQGLGIGLCWPHVCAGVFRFAEAGEKDLAAATMTMVIMLSNAIGSAMAGMVVNLAGLDRGDAAGAAAAGHWLFGLYVLAPAVAFAAVNRILALRRDQGNSMMAP